MVAKDPTIIQHLKPGRRHPKRIRIKAYKLWVKCHDTTKVKRELRSEGYHVSLPTLNKWSEMEDWEAREAVEKNELKRILRQSDDPVLRQLVMDDLEYVKVLRGLRVIVFSALRKKRSLLPKNTKELIDLLKFLRLERDTLLGNVEKKNADKQSSSITINNYDQRKIEFANQLKALPLNERTIILDQLNTAIQQDDEVAEEARKQLNGKTS
jgi:hypothetical protein